MYLFFSMQHDISERCMNFIDDRIDMILVISAVIFLLVGVLTGISIGVLIGNPYYPWPVASIFIGFALLGYAWKREGKSQGNKEKGGSWQIK